MSSQDRNLSTSFDFFRKRKKKDHFRSKHDGYPSSPLSVTSLSESFMNGSQNEKSTSVARKGTFRGILSDNSAPPSKHYSNHESTQEEDVQDWVPDIPEIDLEICKPFNYILWARDQMAFGNEKIVSMNNLEQLFVSQLKELDKQIDNSYGVDKTVMSVIYYHMSEAYKSYNYLLDNSCQYCHFSTVYLNSYIFLRPLDLTNYSFVSSESSSSSELDTLVNSVNIDGDVISGPVFIHESLLPHFEKNCEYLPSKICYNYDYKCTCIEYDYFPNVISRIIFERAMKELIVVKLNIDIKSINLLLIEGYNIDNIKSGEKCWLPIYISEQLCFNGLINVELPIYLTKSHLRRLRKNESNDKSLQKLPNNYFFEISHIFTKFKILYFIP